MKGRTLSTDDAEACIELASTQGWPPELAKWRLLLGLGRGYGVETDSGQLVGCVLRFDCGAMSMIAMMVVHADFGRRGIGTMLMERAIADSDADAITLYATEDGKRLYLTLGFTECGSIIKHTGRLALPPDGHGEVVRALGESDFDAITTLDQRAYGADRMRIVRAHLSLAYGAWVVERSGAVCGYCLAWENLGYRMVGPVVAEDERAARALIARAAHGDEQTRIDIHEPFFELRRWLTDHGMRAHAPAPMMVLRASDPPGDRAHLFAVTNQATG